MLRKFRRFAIIVIIVLLGYLCYDYYMQKEAKIQEEKNRIIAEEQKENLRKEAEERKLLQEKLIKEKLNNAQKFVDSVSDKVQIVALTEKGKFTISHDKTPDKNQVLDFFLNSQIEMEMNYEAIFTLDVSKITMGILEDGSILAMYSKSDIYVSAIDLSNIVPIQNKALFGKEYTSTEIVALEEIAKEKILEYVMTAENIESFSNNIDEYLNNLAKNFNVENIIIEH